MILTLNRCRALPLLHPPAPSYHVVVLLNFILYYFFVMGLQDHVPALSIPRSRALCRASAASPGDGNDVEQSPKMLLPLGSAEIYM